jgi:hypothetical protein
VIEGGGEERRVVSGRLFAGSLSVIPGCLRERDGESMGQVRLCRTGRDGPHWGWLPLAGLAMEGGGSGGAEDQGAEAVASGA